MNLRAPAMIALFTLAAFGQTDRSSIAQTQALPAVESLIQTKLFVFGGFGFSGRKSQAEKAYGELMSRPDRREVLERVFQAGTPEGKSYALVGIYNLDRDRFRVLAAPLRSSGQSVSNGATRIVAR